MLDQNFDEILEHWKGSNNFRVWSVGVYLQVKENLWGYLNILTLQGRRFKHIESVLAYTLIGLSKFWTESEQASIPELFCVDKSFRPQRMMIYRLKDNFSFPSYCKFRIRNVIDLKFKMASVNSIYCVNNDHRPRIAVFSNYHISASVYFKFL